MDAKNLAGNLLIMSVLLPTLLYAVMPLKDYLKYSVKKTFAVGITATMIIAIVFAILSTLLPIHFRWLFAAALIPTFAVKANLTKAEAPKKIYCYFNSTMIAGNSILYGMLLAAPFERDDTFINLGPVSAMVCIVVAIILGLIYSKTLKEKLPFLLTSEPLNLDYRLAIAVTFSITLLFFWVMPNYASVVMTGRVRITILAFLLLAPGAFVLVYHTMWRVAVNLTENAELREANEIMDMEQKRYEELRAYMDETRNLRHDFRQHLLVIDEYAKRGETEKLSDYISQFTDSLKEYRPQIAANPALDAVSAHYEALAESKGIHIKWLIEMPEKLPIKESDYITVFGNLVENAINAVEGLGEDRRSIQVNARMLSDAMIGLTVKNPYEGMIKFNRKGLPRSKRAGHGIGLQSVKVVVDRYGGTLDIDAKDGMFTAGILLYIN